MGTSRGGSRMVVFGVGAVVVLTGACSRRVLELMFDVPARSSVAPAPVRVVRAESTARLPAQRDTAPTPAIELLRDADSVVALLPRDHAGNVDWMQALRRGIIRPRLTLPGRHAPDTAGFRFAFDFLLPGPDTTFDAFFPHSAHTEWLTCQTCHPRVFKYRGAQIRMGDILQGKYCGACHGKVAFPVATGCERCHTKFPMPPNRAKPELIGTVTLRRAAGDSALGGTVAGNAAGVRTEQLPPARFPHWVHRSRYRCAACHTDPFELVAGASIITMKDISEGRACGVCHDGKTAFPASFGYCERCHVTPPKAAEGP
ncbi:MAG: c(7)-type cytochrome triheme domain-containing protein [Gemmatimonadota bacterium]